MITSASIKDHAAFVKRLEAAGIKLDEPPRTTASGNLVTYVADPWGTGSVEIVQRASLRAGAEIQTASAGLFAIRSLVSQRDRRIDHASRGAPERYAAAAPRRSGRRRPRERERIAGFHAEQQARQQDASSRTRGRARARRPRSRASCPRQDERSMAPRSAPSAMRMPISCVRCCTE